MLNVRLVFYLELSAPVLVVRVQLRLEITHMEGLQC